MGRGLGLAEVEVGERVHCVQAFNASFGFRLSVCTLLLGSISAVTEGLQKRCYLSGSYEGYIAAVSRISQSNSTIFEAPLGDREMHPTNIGRAVGYRSSLRGSRAPESARR